MPKLRRNRQIIKPYLQWKVMVFFGSLTACSVLLQSIVLAGTMTSLAGDLPHDGNVLQGKMLGFLGANLLITLAATLPVFLIVSRTATFKIAGPLHRMETHLRQVIREESSGPCVIRKDDELQDFCALLNRALEVPRGQSTEAPPVAEFPLDCEQIPPALPSEGERTDAEPHMQSNTREGTAPQEGFH